MLCLWVSLLPQGFDHFCQVEWKKQPSIGRYYAAGDIHEAGVRGRRRRPNPLPPVAERVSKLEVALLWR
jgi:hypothetical protein